MSRFIERSIDELADKGQDEYAMGFLIAFKRAMIERGKVDGEAAAALAVAIDPDPAEIEKVSRKYAIGYIAAFEHAMGERGIKDGADAAISAHVEPITPKSVATPNGGKT